MAKKKAEPKPGEPGFILKVKMVVPRTCGARPGDVIELPTLREYETMIRRESAVRVSQDTELTWPPACEGLQEKPEHLKQRERIPIMAQRDADARPVAERAVLHDEREEVLTADVHAGKDEGERQPAGQPRRAQGSGRDSAG